MAFSTAFTELLEIEHPVVLAPMGGTAGGALAAAVSNAGGFGLVGGGYGYPERLERELPIVTAGTDRPWGIGFIAWDAPPASVARALEFHPNAVMLSFGDPAPLARLVHEANVRLIVQVTSLAEARRALDAGAHVLVAQGSEAGGHGALRSTLPFVPAVVDIAGSVPVLAAGGIADGRGLAAALTLGAAGALLGTRFVASREAVSTPAEAKAITDGTGDNTERSRLIDIAVGHHWPAPYTIRALRNPFLDHWQGQEDALDADANAKQKFAGALQTGDRSVVPVAAGEAVDLITDVPPAAEIVARLIAQAEHALAGIKQR
jgi:nitronate monooxygenase